MSDTKEQKKDSLTKEQTKIVQGVYKYVDTGEISIEDVKTLRVMFDTPEKFVLLRRVFGILTEEERGLFRPNPDALITANDYEALGHEVAINSKAEEIVRGSLARFYSLIQGEERDDKKKELEEANKKEAESKDDEEKHKEKEAVDNRVGGENL